MTDEEWLDYWLLQAPVLSGLTMERITENLAEAENEDGYCLPGGDGGLCACE